MKEKPPHVTGEMAQLILQVTQAQKRDEEAFQKLVAQVDIERKKWLELPEEKRTELTLIGRGFTGGLPRPHRKWTRSIRKQIRYRIFRIRDGKTEYDKGLKAWLQLQFTKNMNINEFTFTWDISAIEPLKVVQPMEWDGDLVLDKSSGMKYCDPPAFTHQAK